MKLTPQIDRAIGLAAALHRDQARKIGGQPYVSHPFAVALILSDCVDDQDVLAAALLHDVLEDVSGYDQDRMRADFGDRVTDLVLQVSEDKDPNVKSDARATWRDRKEGYLRGLLRHSPEAVMISAADKFHNLKGMNDGLEKDGRAVLDRFNAGQDDQVWFYRQIAEIVERRLPGHELSRLLRGEVARLESIMLSLT
jgi:(p)ppGpp synthase/HD superfamily hydrolase